MPLPSRRNPVTKPPEPRYPNPGTTLHFGRNFHSNSVLIDWVRHEAAHDQISTICGTYPPPITTGGKYHQDKRQWIPNFEYVTDMYAWLYNGLTLVHPNADYAMDPGTSQGDRDTFANWARQIHDSNCGQKTHWVDANGDGLPDDWGMGLPHTDMNNDGYPDIVGFSHTDPFSPGVKVSLNRSGSKFDPYATWATKLPLGPWSDRSSTEFWWTYEYPRTVIDMNKDGFPDIVSFGDDHGVQVDINSRHGGFDYGSFATRDAFTSRYGGWQTAKHPRTVVDVNGDGYPDIVGFADDGVSVALNWGGQSFKPPTTWLKEFGYVAGGWRVEKHPRMVVDVNGDGFPDIVGFADDGVRVSLNQGGKSFAPSTRWTTDFGYESSGWRVDMHPRMLVDMNGDGRLDIVGFAGAGVVVALNQWKSGQAKFAPYTWWTSDFSYYPSGWRVGLHPRMLVDVNKDGYPDIVGFAGAGVVVALNQWKSGQAKFAPYTWWRDGQFGPASTAGQWRVSQHPRMIG